MSTFEYLAIAYSLVLSFSVTRIIAGLPAAAQHRRRYWVHLSLTSFLLLSILASFWSFLAYRDVTWTFSRFVLVLADPSLYYAAACALIPEGPAEVGSWRDYFYSERTRFWITILFWSLTVQVRATLLLDVPWFHPGRAPTGIALVVAATGAAFASERVQAVLAVAVWIVLLGALTLSIGPLSREFAA
jgi:hypothetical protein